MSGGSWKVAYADFVTALMAFFLLMWILSMVPQEKRAEMSVYFMDPGGYRPSDAQTFDPNVAPPPPSSTPFPDEDDLSPAEKQYLAINRFLQDTLKEEIAENKTKVHPSESGIRLRTSNALAFAPGDAALPHDSKKVLDAVIAVMKDFKVHLLISGHTDGAETGAPQFADKWGLSSARAAAVTAYIVEQGHIPASMVMSVSYANYRPIVPDTEEAPNSANRRVEFFFYTPDSRPANIGFE